MLPRYWDRIVHRPVKKNITNAGVMVNSDFKNQRPLMMRITDFTQSLNDLPL